METSHAIPVVDHYSSTCNKQTWWRHGNEWYKPACKKQEKTCTCGNYSIRVHSISTTTPNHTPRNTDAMNTKKKHTIGQRRTTRTQIHYKICTHVMSLPQRTGTVKSYALHGSNSISSAASESDFASLDAHRHQKQTTLARTPTMTN